MELKKFYNYDTKSLKRFLNDGTKKFQSDSAKKVPS